jgi:hypothetical protein
MRVEPLEKQLETITDQLKDPKIDPSDKERLEKDAQSIRNQMQEIGEEAKSTLGKKERDMLVLIYKEVREAASAYALAHDFDLVMHFNDGTNEADMNSTANIERKMGSGPLTPLFSRPGDVDISEPVLALMHLRYKPAPAGPPR